MGGAIVFMKNYFFYIGVNHPEFATQVYCSANEFRHPSEVRHLHFMAILKSFSCELSVVVVDQFTPGYQFTPTLNFPEDL